jgi:hypothetical protein
LQLALTRRGKMDKASSGALAALSRWSASSICIAVTVWRRFDGGGSFKAFISDITSERLNLLQTAGDEVVIELEGARWNGPLISPEGEEFVIIYPSASRGDGIVVLTASGRIES